MGEKEPGTGAKAKAIAKRLRETYGSHPPKNEANVQAWHNELYGRLPDEDESMELFLAVCRIIETWYSERN